jgi:hypothetical protein
MKAEKPASGILKTNDFGNVMFYHVHCDCGNEDDAHEIEIEADDMHVQVHVYVKAHTKWWEKRRWKQIWHLLTRGYAEMQSTIVLQEQAALNYAETLKTAMKDVKKFRDERIAANARKADTNGSGES